MSLPYGFKAKANRIALGLRRQMGLPPEAPINVGDLATKLGLAVVQITDLADACPEHVLQLSRIDKSAFSASLLSVGSRRIILLNDGHGIRRRNSNLAHEVAHALLVHPPAQLLDHAGCRNFDQDLEAQADCLAGHILIPDEAAVRIVWSTRDSEEVCEEYGVSRRMLDFRLNTSGARKRHIRWQQRSSIRTGT